MGFKYQEIYLCFGKNSVKLSPAKSECFSTPFTLLQLKKKNPKQRFRTNVRFQLLNISIIKLYSDNNRQHTLNQSEMFFISTENDRQIHLIINITLIYHIWTGNRLINSPVFRNSEVFE